MTDGIPPERLDELFDGRIAAETDEERDLLRLAAELRAAAPAAPDRLRERVAGLGEPASRPSSARRGWRRARWRFAAPAIAGIVAVLIAAVIVVPRNSGSSDDSSIASTTTPFEAAPQNPGPAARKAEDAASERASGPAGDSASTSAAPTATPAEAAVEGVLRSGSLDDAHDAVQRIVGAAGGIMIRQAGDENSRTVTVDLSRADRPALIDALTALDEVGFDDTALRAAVGDAGTVVIRIRTGG